MKYVDWGLWRPLLNVGAHSFLPYYSAPVMNTSAQYIPLPHSLKNTIITSSSYCIRFKNYHNSLSICSLLPYNLNMLITVRYCHRYEASLHQPCRSRPCGGFPHTSRCHVRMVYGTDIRGDLQSAIHRATPIIP